MVTRRPVVLGAVALALVLTSSDGAAAQETGPVVVADDVELSTAADGVSTFSATVTITGADGPTVVSILVDGAQSCVPLSQPVLASGVTTPITLQLPNTCEIADPASVEFVTYSLGSVAPTRSGTRVTPDVQIADASPAYINLAWGFGLGALLAAVVTALAWKLGPERSVGPLADASGSGFARSERQVDVGEQSTHQRHGGCCAVHRPARFD